MSGPAHPAEAFQKPGAASAANKGGSTGKPPQSSGGFLVKETAMNALITAIRNDKAVGIGSCSVIDECYTDAELAEALAERGITTTRKALQWAKARNKLFWERERELSGEW